MLISSEKKILFFHIPKTAGSSIFKILSTVCTDAHSIRRNLMYHYVKNNKDHRGVSLEHFHVDHAYLKKILDCSGLRVHDYFEFTIVRNPYDRLLSQYNFDLLGSRVYKDFDSFLDLYEDTEYVNPKTPYWYKSQLHWIKNPLSKNSRYYKYEELDKAWVDIREKTNLDLPDLPLANENKVKTMTELKQSHKDRIYNILRDEFELLNYEK